MIQLYTFSDALLSIIQKKITEIWETGFKKIRQFCEHSPFARQAINNHEEEVAFWCKLVVEDRIKIVADFTLQPFIYSFN